MNQQDLEKAFDLVKDPKDWRNPIQACIEIDQKEAVEAAIIHFTATTPTFTRVNSSHLIVKADGYRNGPAGP
jgi:hypothetical protein